jgi:glycosyltransferase involved in cell wall biosynthesis
LLAQYSGRRDIKFTNAYVPVNQIADYFNAADLVVLPHVKASQSGVLMASYAAGKPVVATDSGGLGEVVKNSNSGLVVPPRDANAIAEAVITLLDNPDRRRALGVNAKTSGETTYSWATIAATTADLYRVLNERTPRSDAFPAPRTP